MYAGEDSTKTLPHNHEADRSISLSSKCEYLKNYLSFFSWCVEVSVHTIRDRSSYCRVSVEPFVVTIAAQRELPFGDEGTLKG